MFVIAICQEHFASRLLCNFDQTYRHHVNIKVDLTGNTPSQRRCIRPVHNACKYTLTVMTIRTYLQHRLVWTRGVLTKMREDTEVCLSR